MAGLPQGHVQFTTERPKLTLTVLRTDQVVPSGGVGGWQSVARPLKKALSVWQGRDGNAQSVPILFDGFDEGRSVEADIRTLVRMALPHGNEDPPAVKIDGPVVRRDLEWHIDDIAWGDAIFNDDGTARVRQAATVMLVEAVADERLERAIRQEARRTTRYVVKAGDTLSSIAARKLGDAGRWKEIARLNGIRDPKRIHAGQTIKLP